MQSCLALPGCVNASRFGSSPRHSSSPCCFASRPVIAATSRGFDALAALLVGLLFISALSTALGVLSTNPKTFIVVFLSFWYVVVNDKGATAIFDFAGFYHGGAAGTTTLYAGLTAICVVAALLAHSYRRRRS